MGCMDGLDAWEYVVGRHQIFGGVKFLAAYPD
jgi:hypothetical protein